MEYRIERDSNGRNEVAADRILGGTNTEKSAELRIGDEVMPHSEITQRFWNPEKAAAIAETAIWEPR